MTQKNFIVAWWSAGVTSAIACKMALEMYDNVKLYYIKIDSAHDDNQRFMSECEKWYGCKIEILQSKDYKDQFDVIEKTGAINTPQGAPCTKILKKQVRFDFERLHEISLFNDITILNQVWGFEYNKDEVNRAIRHGQQYPDTKPLFPLIEKGLSKDNCAGKLLSAGIELPIMYKLGYNNNNCIGCVKGGMGYWNKIRVDFPPVFDRMAKLERKIGYTCLHNEKDGNIYLDELSPKRGRMTKEVIPNCGLICDVEFADIPDKNLENVLQGKKTIYEAISCKKENPISFSDFTKTYFPESINLNFPDPHKIIIEELAQVPDRLHEADEYGKTTLNGISAEHIIMDDLSIESTDEDREKALKFIDKVIVGKKPIRIYDKQLSIPEKITVVDELGRTSFNGIYFFYAYIEVTSWDTEQVVRRIDIEGMPERDTYTKRDEIIKSLNPDISFCEINHSERKLNIIE